ncbi:YfjI family protein [Belnapia sp. F-4-1]|uniref:YfjI family protein n=1 Tax=Belnapia sp. F-4-1 TaxID=1545443 RepID=UPI00068D2BC0|nr:YfjI family protein [Belnapia sp. F-4-1]
MDSAFDAAASAALTPRDKRPLHRDVEPPTPFPMQALGPLQAAAEGLQDRVQSPAALCAQSVLAAATLAAQPHADVVLPSGRPHPLSQLFLTVAVSGERKTSADRIALAEVYRTEAEWRDAYAASLDAFKRDHAAWKEATENAKKKGREAKGAQDGGRAEIRAALAGVGTEPREPPHPMMIVSDPTPDGLVQHLQQCRPSAGLFTSEGGGFIGGHAMNDDNRMRTGALLNAVWDGEPIRQQRVMRGLVFLPGRRVTMHLMAQPAAAARLLGDEMLDDLGLLARCLVVEPESTIGTRAFRETTETARLALDAYHGRIGELLRRAPPTHPDDDRTLTPRPLPLAPAARAAWINFHDHVEYDLADGGALRPVRAFGAKLAEHAGRLAGVLTLFNDPDAHEVPAAMMACGIALAQHYAKEALRLQGAASIAPDLVLAQRLLAWWQARPDPQCHLAMIYQKGLNAIRTAEQARRIVGILQEHGFVTPLPPGVEIDGKARREAWILVP